MQELIQNEDISLHNITQELHFETPEKSGCDSDGGDEEAVCIEDLTSLAVTCNQNYLQNGNSKRVLFSMAVGMIDKSGNIISVDVEPFSNAKSRKSFVTSSAILRDEMIRRAAVFSIKCPRNKNYGKERCQQWLGLHPITDENDITFLLLEIDRFQNELMAAAEEEKERKKKWTTNKPYLRLWHAVVHDNAKVLFDKTQDCLDRDELDALNSSEKPNDFWSTVCNIFNDPDFLPISMSLPDLHYSFTDQMSLDLDVPSLTVADLKRRFTDSRAKLIQIIVKWERSGSGFGQRHQQDDDFGHLVNERLEDGDDRANYLGNYHDHLLYAWHILDINQMLTRTVAILDSTVSASSAESVPEVFNSARKRKKDQNTDDIISKHLESISKASLLEQLGNTEQKLAEYEVNRLMATTDEVKEVWLHAIGSAKERLLFIRDQLV